MIILGSNCNYSAEVHNYKVLIKELQIKSHYMLEVRTSITITVPENSNHYVINYYGYSIATTLLYTLTMATLRGKGRFSLHSVFFLSTVFVVAGHSSQVLADISADGAHNIFKCSGLLHQLAQCLAIEQLQFMLTQTASLLMERDGICFATAETFFSLPSASHNLCTRSSRDVIAKANFLNT